MKDKLYNLILDLDMHWERGGFHYRKKPDWLQNIFWKLREWLI